MHGTRFRGRPGKVYFHEMRLRVAAASFYTYPDVMALCEEPNFEGTSGQPPSLLNPEVIVEILSPNTEAFDRGDKFARYRRLESLRDYVLVSADRMRVEHHHLEDDGVWIYEEYDLPSHVLCLAIVGCEIPLAEIYDKVVFRKPGMNG